MDIRIVSYSLSGNNEALACSMATALGAAHTRIVEPRTRKVGRIVLDVLFNRTPRITIPEEAVGTESLVIFIGPVWMGKVATPLRALFSRWRGRLTTYAFVSISGGSLGPNPDVKAELTERLGVAPAAVVDLHIAQLLPPEVKTDVKTTSAYRLSVQEVSQLTAQAVTELRTTLAHLFEAPRVHQACADSSPVGAVMSQTVEELQ